MADTARLETALRNADAAGDTAAARQLAAEIVRLRGSSAPSAPIPNVGETWTDQGGNSFQIVEPTAPRGLGQLTQQDVRSRLAVRPSAPAAPPAATGPTEMRALTDESRQASAAVTNDPSRVAGLLAAEKTPEARAIALRNMGQARGDVRGPVETFTREAVNTAGLGLPRLVASAFGPNPMAAEHEMAKAADARGRQNNPVAGGAGQFTGMAAQALATPLAAVRTAPRAAAYGGAMSGVSTAADTRGDIGATARDALAGSAAGYGLARVTGATPKSKPVMRTSEELESAAQSAYDKADLQGVVFSPRGMKQLKKDVVADLTDFGYHPTLQPRVAVVLSELDRLSNSNVTLKGVEVLRRIANNARMSNDPSEQALGRKIIEHIDRHVETPGPAGIIGGDSATASAALREARDFWRRKRKGDQVEDAVMAAELRASSTGSGGNVDNATRQNIRAILTNPKRAAGFTEEEKAAMEKVVRGTKGQNALRLAGKLSPSGNGLMAALGLGATVANPLMAIPAGLGIVAKNVADKATGKNVNALMELIRGAADDLNLLPRISSSSQRQLEQARVLGLLGMAPSNQNALAELLRQ